MVIAENTNNRVQRNISTSFSHNTGAKNSVFDVWQFVKIETKKRVF